MNKTFITSFFAIFLLICGCSQEEEITEREFVLPDDGIEIAEAWARPGRENGVSAIYMHVLNGSTETDTLLALSSPSAGLVELHETFDRGEGMMGMRQSEEPYFPGREVVGMRPGGLHIMLMQLNEALNTGDEVKVTLTFSLAGDITVTAPVQSPND